MKIKFSKPFKILGIVIASLIVLILIVRGVLNFMVNNKLKNTVETMKAEGRRLEMKDFEILCEDSENAALPWKEIEEMFIMKERKLVSDALNKVLDGETLDKDERVKVEELISGNKPCFEQFKEVLKRPYFKYETNWDQNAFAFRMASAIKLIQFIKYYSMDAFIKAENGKFNDAVDQCLTWLAFTPKLSNEPFLITYLIRLATVRPPLTLLNRMISSRKLDDETLSKILNSLEVDTLQKGLIRSVETEGAGMYDLFRRILEGEELEAKEFGEIGPYNNKFLVWLFRPIIKAGMMYSMNAFDDLIEATRMPYHEYFKVRESYEKKVDNIPRYYVFSKLLIPSATGVSLKKATIEAKILAARAGLACKIYQNRHGTFPEELSQLVPDILSEVPTDPFSGKSLIYRRTPSGFIVYSVGSNGKDDGGRETRQITKIVAEKDDDWVWYEGK